MLYLFFVTKFYKHLTSNIQKTVKLFPTRISAESKYLIQLLGDNVLNEEMVIFREVVLVEVDSTKLGKIKYNRGH